MRSRVPGFGPASLATLLLALLTAAACAGTVATPSPPPTEAPTPTPGQANPPPLLPIGVILTADATLAGELGSYSMDGSGADAPWLPAAGLPSLAIGPLDTLSVALIDGVPIGDSSALMAAPDDPAGLRTRAVPGARLSADRRLLRLGPVPPGRWVIGVRLLRADGRGDGTTYWAITVR